MAEQPRRRESSPRLRPGGTPPQQQPPGWRVTPAPDGRGQQPAKPPPRPNIRWLAVIAVIALIALNYVVAWVLAVIYARVANRVHDPLVQRIVARRNHNGIEP